MVKAFGFAEMFHLAGATDKIRSINFGAFGSMFDFGNRSTSVAQFLSAASGNFWRSLLVSL